MLQVYVTEMPKEKTECPFYAEKEDICAMSHGECCLKHYDGCKHLLTLAITFDFEEVN